MGFRTADAPLNEEEEEEEEEEEVRFFFFFFFKSRERLLPHTSRKDPLPLTGGKFTHTSQTFPSQRSLSRKTTTKQQQTAELTKTMPNKQPFLALWL